LAAIACLQEFSAISVSLILVLFLATETFFFGVVLIFLVLNVVLKTPPGILRCHVSNGDVLFSWIITFFSDHSGFIPKDRPGHSFAG
jgi:hypothetical protein